MPTLPMPAVEHEHSPAARAPREPVAAPADWQTPAYAVVDTALEVTAYRLADR
ncbi:pyrroloquinoline quinone precursor peptide PqqA [Streptomyces sp. WAC 01529]|uniref:pyrroloquinoline quinone precursor peptide PqqA n=1 Tax=Streptomyces sp. WAC 01529 TaxID=2203205 RepID=UPI000F743B21|nr:pyrroloquinoline quinone precursor peptide PqqA [Streptomyces sp. WAC 01529]